MSITQTLKSPKCTSYQIMYRVTHLLANLGCVDFDLGCSTLCLVLPGLTGNWQKWLNSWARWWNIQNQCQPNPGAGFNGRVNGFTRIDSARPVADQ